MSAKAFFLTTFALVFVGALAAGCGDDTSVAPTVHNDAPLLAPQNVEAVPYAGGKVIISWDPNTQSNLLGYNVYRLDVETSLVLKLTPTPITATSYDDLSIAWGKSYQYRVTSVGQDLTESAYATRSVVLPDPTDAKERRDRQDP